jgi:hypothetical protein
MDIQHVSSILEKTREDILPNVFQKCFRGAKAKAIIYGGAKALPKRYF